MTKKREQLSAAERKAAPLARGLLDYFPNALMAVAHLSQVGNEQHHPGEPLHWDMAKSTDEADALMRHLIDRGTIDSDGERHSTKVAWRALANLERELLAAMAEAAEIEHYAKGTAEAQAAMAEQGSPAVDPFYDHFDGEDRSGEAPEVQIEIRRTSEDTPQIRRGRWVDGKWVKGSARKPKNETEYVRKPRML